MANTLRLKEDLDKVLDNPIDGILCFPRDGTMSAVIIFVKNNDGYLFELGVPENYPHSQPAIRMLCGYNHAKTTKDGLICLKAPKSGKWTLEHVMKYMHDLFAKCNNKIISGDGRQSLQPDQVENIRHSAFYYAIRSGKTDFLNSLIQQWPGNMFDIELNEVLSRAYEELKLKNVQISLEMDIIVQNKLLNVRLCSPVRQNIQNEGNIFKNTLEEVQLLLENIALLKAAYFDSKKIDDKFVFIATFIVRIIHTLKRQLKSTYSKLPWEEVEFCLTSFVACHIKQQEINVYCRAFLNKSKVLNTLDNFGKRLNDELKNNDSLNTRKRIDTLFLPNLTRKEVVANIIRDCPEFSDLYSDYEQIRDIHSLMVIRDNIELTLSANPSDKEGQLIITRVLQVIGEYLKNTLESPKLSNTTSDLLLLTLPKNTRKILIDLRNSLSHAYALVNRVEFEEKFCIGIQNDFHKIRNVLIKILCTSKLKIITTLLEKIIDSESLDEIIVVSESFSHFSFAIIEEASEETEHKKLVRLTKELSDIISDKNELELLLFIEIQEILDCKRAASEELWMNYIRGLLALNSLFATIKNHEIDKNDMRVLKFSVRQILENISSHNALTGDLKVIVDFSLEIALSATSRVSNVEGGKSNKIYNLISEIFCVAQFGTEDLKWIGKLKERLNGNSSFIPEPVKKDTRSKSQIYNDILATKVSELKGILERYGLGGSAFDKLSFYLANKKLQAIVEMLVLDILSILDTIEPSTDNNPYFFYDCVLILTGTHLRNHLAHGSTLFDILLVDPSIAVILNARNLTQMKERHTITNQSKLFNALQRGSFVGSTKNDFINLKKRYEKNVITVVNQEAMFAVLKMGDLEEIKCCLYKGADINGIRRIDSAISMHFPGTVTGVSFLLAKKTDITAKDRIGHEKLSISL